MCFAICVDVLHNSDSEDHEEEGDAGSISAESMQLDNLFDPGYDYYNDVDLPNQEYEYGVEEPGEHTNTPSGTAECQMANKASQRGPPGTQNGQQKRKRRSRKCYKPYGNVTVLLCVVVLWNTHNIVIIVYST